MFTLYLLVACTTECDTGFELASDGLCYPRPVEEALPLAELAPCELTIPADRLDLTSGCVDGICVGDAVESAANAFGGLACDGSSCVWSSGIGLIATGEPTATDSLIDAMVVERPFDGASPDGLALGLELSCYVDLLIGMDTVGYQADDLGDLRLDYVSFSIPDVWVTAGADGKVESLTLRGDSDPL